MSPCAEPPDRFTTIIFHAVSVRHSYAMRFSEAASPPAGVTGRRFHWPLVKNVLVRDAQNLLEEIQEHGVRRLRSRDAQRDRQLNFAAFEFALMIEAHSWKRRHERARRRQPLLPKNDGGARLVVVLEEPRETTQVCNRHAEPHAYVADVLIANCVVHVFAVREFESEIHQPFLRAPVRFREENQVWQRRMCFGPEFFLGRLRVAEQMTPDFRENVAELQHRHVAANAVAMSGDDAEPVDQRRAQSRIEVVELRRIRPGREVRIAAQRDEDSAFRRFDAEETCGVCFKICGVPCT